mgnify:FL=1
MNSAGLDGRCLMLLWICVGQVYKARILFRNGSTEIPKEIVRMSVAKEKERIGPGLEGERKEVEVKAELEVEVEIENEDVQGDPNPGLDLDQGNEVIEDVGAAIEVGARKDLDWVVIELLVDHQRDWVSIFVMNFLGRHHK